MGDTPVLSPALPRIAAPTLHMRTPSRSPTRQRLADDILSDLTPATTLEAFKSPSGRLKTSIEVATPSERAFGLRAALASKNIQEWVDELSNWPWPAEGGSLGFEVPPAKRRKLSSPTSDGNANHYEQNGTRQTREPEYTGSLLAQEVLRYEIRLDEIIADMEELNVEEIKRQVLDTHFSPKSRPSSSASNAPMPSFLSSYTKMDDFTAIVTATVLQALPNLSRLMRLMDVWSIRLSVLRKVPPLLLALEDTEIALKSGWNVINTPMQTNNGEGVALSRETFGIMRDVLQDKVTTLGQDLDYMLDTLEGREDTLPESWLDRMETIEQDYGEWVVSGDRKVREGEWAKMAKAGKEAEEARKLKEAAAAKAAEEAETARRKAQKEAEKALAEIAKRKAEKDAEDAKRARLQVLQDVEDVYRAELAKQRAQQEAQEAQVAEMAKRKAEEAAREAEVARRRALKDAEDAHGAEMAQQKAQKEADAAAAKTVRRKAEKDVEDAERARQQAQRDAEDESARLQSLKDAEETERERQRAHQDAKDAELARRKAQRRAEDDGFAEQQAREVELARQQTQKDVEDAETARLQAFQDSVGAEAKSRKAQKELEDATVNENAIRQAAQDAEDEVAGQREASLVKSSHLPGTKVFNGADMELAAGFVAGAALATYFLKKSDIVYEAPPSISKFPPFDGNDSEESEAPTQTPVDIPCSQHVGVNQNISKKHADQFNPEAASLASPINFDAPQQHSPSTPSTPKTKLSPVTDPENTESPRSPKIPQFSHAFANFIRPASTPNLSGQERPSSSDSSTRRSPVNILDGMTHREESVVPPHSPKPLTGAVLKQAGQEETSLGQSNNAGWIVVDSLENTPAETSAPPLQSSDPGTNHISGTDGSRCKRHSRNISVATGYSIADPTPEIHDAEPAEYFRPAHSPIKTARYPIETSEPITASKSPLMLSESSAQEALPVLDRNETPTKSPIDAQVLEVAKDELSSIHEQQLVQSSEIASGGDICSACDEVTREIQTTEIVLPALARKASITRINSGIRQISIPSPRRESISDTPTIVKGQVGETPSSPMASPVSSRSPLEPFPEADESPSAGRIGLRIGTSYDYSPPDSPPPVQAISKHGSLHLQKNQIFSSSDLTAPLTPLEPPLLDDVDISPVPLSSPKKASSDEQLQQQISTLLESIPARIRLTSEPDPGPFSPNTLHPKKTRRSITPFFRSSSSMSNYSTNSYTRSPTPSFTLAPAFSKTSHRSRTPGNPEIKLYHLSRSTGEAPIKLFVRLVGEHGERVMVRVGGGWADLGEYLKEYASHHGRRTVADNDRVEIQDLPPRSVSNSSTISSSATLRGTGRDSPVSRPHSVLERPIDRPGSSLNIRKARKSTGESESVSRGNDTRSPSTPLPNINRRSYETPPSAAGSEASSSGTGQSLRSSSRLSWTEEDSSLGLAGPKSKKVVISEKDQEWVESMKEKVRLASAEKERRNREREASSQRRTSFGEMEKVGGTKRLFRKSGV